VAALEQFPSLVKNRRNRPRKPERYEIRYNDVSPGLFKPGAGILPRNVFGTTGALFLAVSLIEPVPDDPDHEPITFIHRRLNTSRRILQRHQVGRMDAKARGCLPENSSLALETKLRGRLLVHQGIQAPEQVRRAKYMTAVSTRGNHSDPQSAPLPSLERNQRIVKHLDPLFL
jgi:hypothetical protein